MESRASTAETFLQTALAAAVLRVEKGQFGFTDSNNARMKGTQRLVGELTLRDGKVVWDLNGITRDDWEKLPPGYGTQGDPKWDSFAPATPRAPTSQR